MAWSELREKFADVKPGTFDFYTQRIHELVLAGFKLADAEMEELYTKLVGEYDNETYCWPYFEDRSSTYPAIRQTKPQGFNGLPVDGGVGVFAYGTHDRAERVEEAIIHMGYLHLNDEAWVMPVMDDEEYVSWDFDVIVGSREEVIETLRRALKEKP